MQYFLPKPFTRAEFRALLETIKADSNSFPSTMNSYMGDK